jgi:hypothetical protein
MYVTRTMGPIFPKFWSGLGRLSDTGQSREETDFRGDSSASRNCAFIILSIYRAACVTLPQWRDSMEVAESQSTSARNSLVEAVGSVAGDRA